MCHPSCRRISTVHVLYTLYVCLVLAYLLPLGHRRGNRDDCWTVGESTPFHRFRESGDGPLGPKRDGRGSKVVLRLYEESLPSQVGSPSTGDNSTDKKS